MNTAVINIRTNEADKLKAQKLAKEFGMSLSSFINGLMKQAIRTKRVVFDLDDEIPNAQTIKDLKESEEDYKKGDYYSFDDPRDAVKFLDKIDELGLDED